MPAAPTDFSAQYRDPRWQRRRLEVMKAAGWMCQECFDDQKTLNVHHRRYIRGQKIWEYLDDQLICLCEDCHRKIHALKDSITSALANVDVDTLEVIFGFAVFQAAKCLGTGSFDADLSSVNVAHGVAIAAIGNSDPLLDYILKNSGDGHHHLLDFYQALHGSELTHAE